MQLPSSQLEKIPEPITNPDPSGWAVMGNMKGKAGHHLVVIPNIYLQGIHLSIFDSPEPQSEAEGAESGSALKKVLYVCIFRRDTLAPVSKSSGIHTSFKRTERAFNETGPE